MAFTNNDPTSIRDANADGFWYLGTAPTELTIASGVVTVTQMWHTVDTQADASSDDLDTINGGVKGIVIAIQANNTARTVVLKNGTGNLKIGADFSLDNTDDLALLLYDGSNWIGLSLRSNGT